MDFGEQWKEELVSAVQAFAKLKLAVIGDIVVDEHVHGFTSRISREAPVLILQEAERTLEAGGAGNAFLNLVTLGAECRLYGVLGSDPPASALLESFAQKGWDSGGIVLSKERDTPRLTRIWAGSPHTSPQQVIRLDKEPRAPVSRKTFEALLKELSSGLAQGVDGVVLSDYGRGTIPESFRKDLMALLERYGIPVFVDSRKDFVTYKGAAYFLPSEAEVEESLGLKIDSDPLAIERAGLMLLERLGEKTKALLITLGSMGMALFEPGIGATFLEAMGPTEVTDVTGAGDTVTAVFALASLAGLSPKKAALLSDIAGGLVVMKRGCAQLTQKELIDGVYRVFHRGRE